MNQADPADTRRMRLSRGRLLLLVPLAALALYLFLDRREAAAREERLGSIASEIAGRPVQVRCQGRFAAVSTSPPSRERFDSTRTGSLRTGPT